MLSTARVLLCVPHALNEPQRPPGVHQQAEDGGVFVYDLLQSPVMPVASAQLPRGGDADGTRGSRLVDVGDKRGAGAAYSVSFNPRQRDLLATGDSRGRVIIWRMSWRLANKRPGEDGGLERLFKGSVGGVSVPLKPNTILCHPDPQETAPGDRYMVAPRSTKKSQTRGEVPAT